MLCARESLPSIHACEIVSGWKEGICVTWYRRDEAKWAENGRAERGENKMGKICCMWSSQPHTWALDLRLFPARKVKREKRERERPSGLFNLAPAAHLQYSAPTIWTVQAWGSVGIASFSLVHAIYFLGGKRRFHHRYCMAAINKAQKEDWPQNKNQEKRKATTNWKRRNAAES